MIEFLRVIWELPPSPTVLYGELRSIHNGTVKQEFFYRGVADGASFGSVVPDRAVFLDQAGLDVYYGVLLRTDKRGGATDCLSSTHVLWADVDAKHFDGSKAAALFALGRANLSPSILVDSGNGFHAYWLLNQRVPFADASGVMRELAKAIGGDAVHDASRVLRLPGTHNHKTDPPNPVRLLHFEPGRRYRFADFDAYTPPPIQRHVFVGLQDPVAFAELPEWLHELIVTGAPQGTRSEMAFKVCVWLLRYGWTEEMIDTLFRSVPHGIGEKMAEMKQEAGDRWLDRTIKKAQEAA